MVVRDPVLVAGGEPAGWMRRMMPLSTRTPRESYTAWREIAPISVFTDSVTSSAVLCGWWDTARRMATRCAVTWTWCSRRSATGSKGM